VPRDEAAAPDVRADFLAAGFGELLGEVLGDDGFLVAMALRGVRDRTRGAGRT